MDGYALMGQNWFRVQRCLMTIRLINLINKLTKMRSAQIQPSQGITLALPKNFSHSVSTQESPRPPSEGKVKSQLCKKYMQFGVCPYGDRCKFAHGQHELRKDRQRNCRYKTKQCCGFVQQGFCGFGNCCNFIHPPPTMPSVTQLDVEMLTIRAAKRGKSRLMELLTQQ